MSIAFEKASMKFSRFSDGESCFMCEMTSLMRLLLRDLKAELLLSDKNLHIVKIKTIVKAENIRHQIHQPERFKLFSSRRELLAG